MLTHFRPGLPRATFLIIGMLTILLCAACRPERVLQLSGSTMGTTYHIEVVAGWFTSRTKLQRQIDNRLAAINQSMSTYDPESEISRFNAIKSTSIPFVPSDDFFNVLQVAAELHRLTDGAWDGTLDPLINLWGFGRKGLVEQLPDDGAIEQVLAHVGFDRIRLDASGTITKNDPELTLDLASIAKGYGVDEIARLLGARGFLNFLVEIGGEVYARGRRQDGTPWRVGIDRPDKGATQRRIYTTVSLENQAMATSGDYRLFFRMDNQYYSHILDPRTGRPVSNGVVSATVVAANCTVADGLATALMVMGPTKGVALVDQLASVACLIVVRRPDGTLSNHPSRGFTMR